MHLLTGKNIAIKKKGEMPIARNSFIQMSKLTNVKGRITYISSRAKQENLYAVYETTERQFWRELAKYNQEEFRKSGTEGKCIEARELIIALPESFVEYDPYHLLKLFTEYFKKNYEVECVSALHHNKRKTNYHIHLIFSERQLLKEPIIKIASRNMFYDEKGKHVRTKKEILGESGEIRTGCHIIKKGEVYEKKVFTKKDERFKSERFLDEVKHSFTDLMNVYVRNDEEKLNVFQHGSVYLPTKKIGKNNPKEEEIRADNAIRQEWNRTVDMALVEGVPEEKILKIKKEEKDVKEKSEKNVKRIEISDLDENLNEKLQEIFKNIEASAIGSPSEENFKGLFDDIDVNSNKLGPTVIKRNKRLKKLITVIGDMDLGNYQDNSIDAFGDTYEYLMGMYASNAGKSGGEFFTPQEVSELLTRISLLDNRGKMKTEVNKVYDPAVGSGSLLLKFAKILGKDNVRNGFFGQEINITTYNLCRINMFLHDIGYDKFSIEHGDTLTDPKHWDEEPFEAIVSNPPYSIKWEGSDNGTLINDPRFSPAGVLAPKSKADFAFIMHCLSWLATDGTAAIVCFPGIMYRGGAEQKIRKYLIDNNYIECIIQLPDNLFYGTSIATCIMVLKKSKVDNQTLFIDASKEFVKSTNSNKLGDGTASNEPNNIQNILNAYINRKTEKHFTALVKQEDIENADYNLSVSTYVESENTREVIDIAVLNEQISQIVKHENTLRPKIDAIIAEIEEA